MKITRRTLTTFLGLLFSLAVILYAALELNWQETYNTFKNLNWFWLLAALLIFILNYWLRTWRFYVLIYTQEAPVRDLFSVTCLYGMFNYLLPAKTGEISYLVLVNRRLGVSLTESALVLLAARFFDLATIALFLPIVLIAFWQRLPPWIIYPSVIFCALFYLLAGVVLGFLRRPPRQIPFQKQAAGSWADRVIELWRNLDAGLRLIGQRGQLGKLWLLTIGIWLCVYTNFYFIVLSLGYRLNYLQMIVISIIMIPLTLLPIQGFANLGTHEAGWMAAFALFGLPSEVALNISVSSHVILFAFVLILGGMGFLLGLTCPQPDLSMSQGGPP